MHRNHHPLHHNMLHGVASSGSTGADGGKDADDSKSGIPIPPSKPKIWSLADTAVCKTPPPPQAPGGGGGGHAHLNHWATPNVSSAAGFNALRGNMFGMGRPEFGMVPSSMGDGSQTDTPPQTPPTNNNKALAGLMGGHMGSMFGQGAHGPPGGYNGLQNGYMGGHPGAAAAASGFKMM